MDSTKYYLHSYTSHGKAFFKKMAITIFSLSILTITPNAPAVALGGNATATVDGDAFNKVLTDNIATKGYTINMDKQIVQGDTVTLKNATIRSSDDNNKSSFDLGDVIFEGVAAMPDNKFSAEAVKAPHVKGNLALSKGQELNFEITDYQSTKTIIGKPTTIEQLNNVPEQKMHIGTLLIRNNENMQIELKDLESKTVADKNQPIFTVDIRAPKLSIDLPESVVAKDASLKEFLQNAKLEHPSGSYNLQAIVDLTQNTISIEDSTLTIKNLGKLKITTKLKVDALRPAIEKALTNSGDVPDSENGELQSFSLEFDNDHFIENLVDVIAKQQKTTKQAIMMMAKGALAFVQGQALAEVESDKQATDLTNDIFTEINKFLDNFKGFTFKLSPSKPVSFTEFNPGNIGRAADVLKALNPSLQAH